MADAQSDTGADVSTEVVDTSAATSTDDVAQDTDADTSLEDIEVSLDELEGDETDEPSKDEKQDTEPADTEEDDELTEEQSDESSDDETDEEDTPSEDSEDKPLSTEERKRLNDEAAKRRIAEKKLKEAEEDRLQDNLQRYLDDAGNDEQELAKRQLEVEAFNLQREKSEVVQDKLTLGIDKAYADIDLFRTGSDAVKQDLVSSLDEFEAIYVDKDQNGNIVNVRGDVYEHLKNKADSIRRILDDGARTQAKAKTKAKARTETLPTRAPKQEKVDSDLNDFDAAFK